MTNYFKKMSNDVIYGKDDLALGSLFTGLCDANHQLICLPCWILAAVSVLLTNKQDVLC